MGYSRAVQWNRILANLDTEVHYGLSYNLDIEVDSEIAEAWQKIVCEARNIGTILMYNLNVK